MKQQQLQQFNEQYKQFLDKQVINFPLSKIWFSAAIHSLMRTTAFKLGVNATDMFSLFKKLQDRNAQLTLWEFAQCNNAINELSYMDLIGVTTHHEDYFALQIESEEYSRLWNEQTKAKYAELEREIMSTEVTNKLRPAEA